LYNRLAQASEHVFEVVFFAMNSFLQDSQIFTYCIKPYRCVSYRIISYQTSSFFNRKVITFRCNGYNPTQKMATKGN